LSIKKSSTAFLYDINLQGSFLNNNFQVTDRGGIIEATADHSDIRGLVTAFHIFSAELPLS
jgi:hypothetical protein